MKDTSRQNSTTVEMAVESVTTAIKKKAAGVDMKFAPGFDRAADLWCDVDVGVLGTWEKEYRIVSSAGGVAFGLCEESAAVGHFAGCAQGVRLVSFFWQPENDKDAGWAGRSRWFCE